MRIVQPVMTYNGDQGWVVYSAEGDAIAFIQQRHPMPRLGHVVGEHVELGLSVSVTVQQWRRWAHQMPGSEALTC